MLPIPSGIVGMGVRKALARPAQQKALVVTLYFAFGPTKFSRGCPRSRVSQSEGATSLAWHGPKRILSNVAPFTCILWPTTHSLYMYWSDPPRAYLRAVAGGRDAGVSSFKLARSFPLCHSICGDKCWRCEICQGSHIFAQSPNFPSRKVFPPAFQQIALMPVSNENCM